MKLDTYVTDHSNRGLRADTGGDCAERSAGDLAMERYASGDDAAFEQVYDAAVGPLLSFLRRRVRDDLLVEDLTQQTFLQMHRGRASFAAGSAVVPWAISIARRLFIDHIRYGRRRGAERQRSLEEVDVGSFSEDGLLEARDLAGRLQRELLRLPESQREAFALMRFDGLSHIDAARELGITVPALKLRAHRAYVSLRAAATVYRKDARRSSEARDAVVLRT
jgi:RNA polymerase sigma-70 factor (ECF subfamily)